MVASAEQARVGKFGLAAIDPVNQMVAVTPIGRPVAAGETAASVADDQRTPQGRWNGASAAADVDRL